MFYDITWRPHQEDGSDWLSKRQTGILCFPTGQGKGLGSLYAYGKLQLKQPHFTKVIVLCPKNALSSWVGDLKQHCDLEFEVWEKGTPRWADVTIVLHTRIEKFRKHMTSDIYKKAVFIVDEIDLFSNPRTAMWDNAYKLISGAKVLWGLTATLVHNDLDHTFHTSQFLHRGASPFGTLTNFRRKYIRYSPRQIRQKQSGRTIEIMEVIGHKNTEHLKGVLAQYIYRSETQAKIRFKYLPVELTVEEEAEYMRLGRSLFKDNNMEAAALMHGLQKMVDGCFFDQDGAKLKELRRILPDFLARGNPFIIYVAYHDTRKRVEQLLTEEGVEYRSVIGSATARHRSAVVHRIKQGGPICIVMTKAGLRGINLQCAESTLCYDTPMDVKDLVQLLGRQSRLGSPYESNFAFFLSVRDTIDEYKAQYVQAHAELVLKVLSGSAVLPRATETVTKGQVVQLRRRLLWGSRKKTSTVRMVPVVHTQPNRKVVEEERNTVPRPLTVLPALKPVEPTPQYHPPEWADIPAACVPVVNGQQVRLVL